MHLVQAGGKAAPDSDSMLLVQAATRRQVRVQLEPDRPSIVGSGASADVRIEDGGLLPRHVQFARRHDEVIAQPVDAAPLTLNGRPVSEPVALASGDWLGLGSVLFQVRLGDAAVERPRPRAGPPPGARVITIGRLPDNDVTIDTPVVSRRHARLVRGGDGWTVEDLGSTNGTFLNGQRITGSLPVRPGDRLEVGSFAYRFDEDRLDPVDGAGTVKLEARGLGKTVADAATGRPKALLAGVDLTILPGEFVGIFGTSGSGKSTLMDALNGRRPATDGAVLYNGLDIRRSFPLFKSTIGYVPQQDIVHRKITIRRALAYTARLRLPEDTSADEIARYVDDAIERVGLADKGDQPIDTPVPLSGGQLKRVSLAVELVSNPALLFLDEATSGLDAGTDKRMMQLFSRLADDRKTVVCVTHTLENVDVCHLVVVLFQGRVVYFGPPAGVLDHFEIRRLSDVYDTLENAPAERWAERYEASAFHRDYVARRLAPVEQGSRPAEVAVPATRPRRWFDARQGGILTRRYIDLVLSDRRNLAILLLQAPLIGVVVGLVFGTGETLAQRAVAESQLSFMLVISAVWFGCLNAAREIVKELPIYARERSVNLGVGPYLASKLMPLAALCAIQCVGLLVAVSLFIEVPGNLVQRGGALFLTGLAATAMGLAISALMTTTDKAVAMVPILLIPQVILSNAVVRLTGTVEGFAKATTLSYWGYDAVKATLDPEVRGAVDLAGKPLVFVAGTYPHDMMILGLFCIVFVAIAGVALRVRDRVV